MFEAIGHPVSRLKRVRIGGLTDRGLKPGQIRDLTPDEVSGLTRSAVRVSSPRPRRRQIPSNFPSAITIPPKRIRRPAAPAARNSRKSSFRAPAIAVIAKNGGNPTAELRKTMAAGLDLRRVIRTRQRSSRAVIFADAPTAALVAQPVDDAFAGHLSRYRQQHQQREPPTGMRNGGQGHHDDFGGEPGKYRAGDRVAETEEAREAESHLRPVIHHQTMREAGGIGSRTIIAGC